MHCYVDNDISKCVDSIPIDTDMGLCFDDSDDENYDDDDHSFNDSNDGEDDQVIVCPDVSVTYIDDSWM